MRFYLWDSSCLLTHCFLILGGSYFALRYDLLEELDGSNFSLDEREIKITDDLPKLKFSPDNEIDSQTGRVRIQIHGVDFSSPTDLDISPYFYGKYRYQGWLAVFRLRDNFAGKKSIVIVQRLDEMLEDASNVMKIRFRYIYITEGEETRIEIVPAREINSIGSSPVPTGSSYKVRMANYVRPAVYTFSLPEPEKIWLERWRFVEPFVMLFLLVTGLILFSYGLWQSRRLRSN